MAVVVEVLKVVVGIVALLAGCYLVVRFWSTLFGDVRAAAGGPDRALSGGSCPCGCGRSLGWQKRRTALHAVDLKVGLPIVERLAELLPDGDPDRQEAVSWYERGAALAGVMLRMAHGEVVATSAIPSPRDLARWREGANVAAAAVAADDPGWIEQYCDSLGEADRRLVESMITVGTLSLHQRR